MSTSPKLTRDPIEWDGSQGFAHTTTGARVPVTANRTLQLQAETLLRRAKPVAGAAILLEVATGNVLAMASLKTPIYPVEPLFDHAPSASIFKLITTAALLEYSDVTPKTQFCFAGGNRRIERKHLTKPLKNGSRCAPFFDALGFSRNAVYAQVVTEYLMRGELEAQAKRLGFNQPVPFDIEVPMGSMQLPFNDLEFARAAAGFQDTSLTPLGVAHLTYAIVLDGRAGRMRLVAPHEGRVKRELLGRTMSSNTAWRLRRMMEVTVHSGTSLEAFTNEMGVNYLGDIKTAGKTGTLQKRKSGPTTSWFTGFAPARAPKVIVTVLLQNGKVWHRRANEVARDVLRSYFVGRRGVSDPFAKSAKAVPKRAQLNANRQ